MRGEATNVSEIAPVSLRGAEHREDRLRRRLELTASFRDLRTRGDGVIPFGMEGIAADVESSHFRVADFHALGVGVFVEFAAHGEAGLRCRRRDQFDDRRSAGQRTPAPVLRDVTEKAMLDLVPLWPATIKFAGSSTTMIAGCARQGQTERRAEPEAESGPGARRRGSAPLTGLLPARRPRVVRGSCLSQSTRFSRCRDSTSPTDRYCST